MLQEKTEQLESAVAGEFLHVKNKTEELEHVVFDELSSARKAIMMYVGSIEEAPIFMQFNQYIQYGYSPPPLHFPPI